MVSLQIPTCLHYRKKHRMRKGRARTNEVKLLKTFWVPLKGSSVQHLAGLKRSRATQHMKNINSLVPLLPHHPLYSSMHEAVELTSNSYVCSQDVHDYKHFGAGQCPLYDDTDARHDDEVKAAEAEALKKVRVDNPDMTEEELKVKVSDAVNAQERQARERRRRQNPEADILARAHGGGHMMGHGMAFADPQGVPHVHHPQVVRPPFIPEAFGPALYGMPQPFQVPHWVGGGAPHGPMPMMGPQQAAAHFYGVAPQPFENHPYLHNWANFMQQDMAHRHR